MKLKTSSALSMFYHFNNITTLLQICLLTVLKILEHFKTISYFSYKNIGKLFKLLHTQLRSQPSSNNFALKLWFLLKCLSNFETAWNQTLIKKIM